MRNIIARGSTVCMFCTLLHWGCSTGHHVTKSQAPPQEDAGTLEEAAAPQEAVETVSEEPVKVAVFRSREALGLICDLVPEKFDFDSYMLVAVGDTSQWCESTTKDSEKPAIKKAAIIENADPAEFIQSLPQGVYFQKQPDEMVVVAYIVKDDNKIPGKCPKEKAPKTGEPSFEMPEPEKNHNAETAAREAAGLPWTLYQLPSYDGSIRSSVYETHIPCLPAFALKSKEPAGKSEKGAVPIEIKMDFPSASGKPEVKKTEKIHGSSRIQFFPELGSGEEEAVVKTIRLASGKITKCFKKFAKKNVDLEAKFIVTFIIAPDGKVKDIEFIQDDIGSSKLKNCIVKTFKKIKFPKNISEDTDVIAEVPLVFVSNS